MADSEVHESASSSTATQGDDEPAVMVAETASKATRIDMPKADTSVESVTVYEDRAEVTRHATVNPDAPGLYDIVFSDLTLNLDPNTLRVKGMGPMVVVEVSSDEYAPESGTLALDVIR